jgi:hypothetical protein
MQLLIEQKSFVWLSLLPTLGLAVVTVCWKGVLIPAILTLVNSEALLLGEIYSFGSTWITLFFIYWQMMVLYLLIRFKLVFG